MSYINNCFSLFLSVPALITGILLYHNLPLGIIAIFGVIAVLTALYHIEQRKYPVYNNTAFCLIWILIGCGASWQEWRDFNSFYSRIGNKTATITGTVIDYQDCAHMRNNHRITLKMTQITILNTEFCINGTLLVYIHDPYLKQRYPLGTKLCIENTHIKKPEKEFAYYIVKEGIVGTIFVTKDSIKKISYSHFWYTGIHHIRAQLFKNIQKKLSPDHFALFSALFLGNKTYNKTDTEPIQDKFRMWGIAHIFARSGMHISIIIGILLYLLFLIPCSQILKIALITSITLVYTLCSWSSISFIRSLVMCLLTNYSITNRRYVSPLYVLALTTVIILLWHPLNLFFLDFQLSFSLTGALIWIYTKISAPR